MTRNQTQAATVKGFTDFDQLAVGDVLTFKHHSDTLDATLVAFLNKEDGYYVSRNDRGNERMAIVYCKARKTYYCINQKFGRTWYYLTKTLYNKYCCYLPCHFDSVASITYTLTNVS